MGQNHKREYINLIESLSHDLLHDIDSSKEYLEDNGYDLKEVSKEGSDFIESLKRKKRLELAKHQQSHLAKLRKLFIEKKESITSNTITELASLLSNGNQPAYERYFNKLSKVTKEDIEQMDDEQHFLAWLENEDESKD